MNARTSLSRLAAIVAVAAVGIVIPAARPSSASSVPFTDQYANGVIGFCDRQGHPITSGSLLDVPFVWRAVSSSSAPSGYAQGLAVLYAYQPIQYEDPANWSGQQLTGGSWYSNPTHPIAQATNADVPLLYFTQAYPPHWDGLVEIRMYFTAYNTPPENTSYPATIVRVQGNNWSVVNGGNVACNSGNATALETKTLPASELAKPASIGLVSPTKGAGTKGSRSTAWGSHTSGAATSLPSSSAAKSAFGTGASSSNGSGLSGLDIALITLASLVGIGASVALLFSRHRRRVRLLANQAKAGVSL